MGVKIYSEVFNVFYTVLLDRFTEDISQKRVKLIGERNYKLWFENSRHNNEPLFPQIFGLRYPNFFSNKLPKYNADGVDFLQEKPDTIIASLEFLGYSIPKEIRRTLSPILKAKILIQLFLEEHMPDFLEQYSDELRIYDTDGHLINSVKINISSSTKGKTELSTSKNIDLDSNDPLDVTEQLDKLIFNYFDNINKNKYVDAYDLLSVGCKEYLFKNNLRTFIDSFLRTVSISDVDTFNYHLYEDSSIVYLNVFYREKRKIYLAEEITGIEYTPVADFKDLEYKLELFARRLNKITPKPILPQIFRISELLNNDLVDFLLKNSGLKIHQVEDFLTYAGESIENRLCGVWLQKEDNNWLIRSITWMTSKGYL